ncbi:MAG: hypothetical protein Q7J76_07890 [Candidatus Brocadiaceae bacterium]|uniref:hypothetical protein n=1 Tax=Candidatus Wunengus sp. YC61 TaxID=3367698 RepID=UPI002719EB84|nr:hypothetical protein [Candidatus Brocadiaceae bacterium]
MQPLKAGSKNGKKGAHRQRQKNNINNVCSTAGTKILDAVKRFGGLDTLRLVA